MPHKTFDPKDAKPHERWNRARAALYGYKQEAGIDESYISGISDQSILRAMLVDLQLMMVERERERELAGYKAIGMQYGPQFTNHPDTVGLDFIVHLGGKDIYRGDDTTSATFIVITGIHSGAYITTDNLLRIIPGYFNLGL